MTEHVREARRSRAAGGVSFEPTGFGADGCLLEVHGELDLMTVEALRAALVAATGMARRLVVDLSGVTFVDSISLSAIVSARRRLGLQGRLAVVVPPASYARVVIEAAGLASVLCARPTREQALAAVEA